MFGLDMIAKEREIYHKAIDAAEANAKNYYDTFIETDYAQDVRDRMVEQCNAIIKEQGVKKGIKALEKALGLRSTGLIFNPNSFDSPVLKMWHKDITFHGFKAILKDETPLWALQFTCDFTWEEGKGKQKETLVRTMERTIHFEQEITPDLDVDALFAAVR